MLSKSKANYIISLQRKKTRINEGVFVIEGEKIVKDFLSAGMRIKALFAVEDFINRLTPGMLKLIGETEPVGNDDLRKLSSLTTPHNALAVVPMFNRTMPESLGDGFSAALDFIQDPGNLGTIIRSAAWFGIRNIYCSPDCVDLYNPKVVQASMGAILHVNVFYTDLKYLLQKANDQRIKVFGAVIDGESLYSLKPVNNGVILLGNESRGISGELHSLITSRITIPKFNDAEYGIDSLNVSMAAGIIFSEFRRSAASGA